jgi:hypothetical protein
VFLAVLHHPDAQILMARAKKEVESRIGAVINHDSTTVKTCSIFARDFTLAGL